LLLRQLEKKTKVKDPKTKKEILKEPFKPEKTTPVTILRGNYKFHVTQNESFRLKSLLILTLQNTEA